MSTSEYERERLLMRLMDVKFQLDNIKTTLNERSSRCREIINQLHEEYDRLVSVRNRIQQRLREGYGYGWWWSEQARLARQESLERLAEINARLAELRSRIDAIWNQCNREIADLQQEYNRLFSEYSRLRSLLSMGGGV
jgi:DNA repair exonuclease SbcCD ATPase subunit